MTENRKVFPETHVLYRNSLLNQEIIPHWHFWYFDVKIIWQKKSFLFSIPKSTTYILGKPENWFFSSETQTGLKGKCYYTLHA